MQYTENGNEIPKMSKEEASASVDDMGKMMEYFDGTCEHCGQLRKNCSIGCIEKQLLKRK